MPWPLPSWLAAAPVFLVPAPVLAFVREGDVPRTDPVVPLPVRASFRYSLVCWQYWSVDIVGVFLRWYYGGLSPLLISSSIYEKRLHALSNHRRGPVEEPPRAERALRGGSKFRFPAYCFVVQLRFEVSGIPTIMTVLGRTRLLFEISWGHYRYWAAEFWGSCVHS